MTNKVVLFSLLASVPFGLAACAGGEQGYETATSALEQCVFGTPAITDVTEDLPGPVAPGITKVYQVKVLNTNSATCSPATLTFIPDSFHYISAAAQPANIAGVSSGAVAGFRVEVRSDASLGEGVYDVGFTVVSQPAGTSARGSLRFEISLTNPVGCYRQKPQISVNPASPAAVPAGTAQTYQVTVANADNRECGPDSFSVIPDSFHMFGITANGPLPIAPGATATFSVTATSASQVLAGVYDLGFTVVGAHHGSVTNRGSLRYTVQ